MRTLWPGKGTQSPLYWEVLPIGGSPRCPLCTVPGLTALPGWLGQPRSRAGKGEVPEASSHCLARPALTGPSWRWLQASCPVRGCAVPVEGPCHTRAGAGQVRGRCGGRGSCRPWRGRCSSRARLHPAAAPCGGKSRGSAWGGTHSSPPQSQTPQQTGGPPPWQHILGHVGELGSRGAPE